MKTDCLAWMFIPSFRKYVLWTFSIFFGLSVSCDRFSSTASSESTNTMSERIIESLETLIVRTFRDRMSIDTIHLPIYDFRFLAHGIPGRNGFVMDLRKLTKIVAVLNV